MSANADPTDAQVACFEAGIKFGSLYHQFAGTPVNPASADSLAAAIEDAIENQPHCTDVVVDIHEDDLAAAIGDAGYTELTGRFMDVDVRIEYEGQAVHAQMRMDDGYPLMEVVAVQPVES
jgi:hypothetical protein